MYIHRWGAFKAMWDADGKKGTVGNFRWNLFMSGITFYLYNEVSTLALGKISGVTHSVANTAKRVIVIVGVAIILGESKHDPPHSRIARLWFAMPCPCVS